MPELRSDLVAGVIAEAMLADGGTVARVAAHTGLDPGDVAALDMLPEGAKVRRAPRWTDAEFDFLRENAGRLSDVEIGAALGRSPNAIKIKRTRLDLDAPTKLPGTLTLCQVAHALHVDIHAVVRWVDALGILRASDAPVEGREVRLVTLDDLKRFVIRPQNWIYFRPARVRDPRLRRLVQLAAARWDDEWLRIGDVARMHGVTSGAVRNHILRGKLPAVDWGNWKIRRSDAERARFAAAGRGLLYPWTDALDAFLVLGDAVGLMRPAQAALTGMNDGTISYRLSQLRTSGAISGLIERAGLDVQYRAEDGALFADWQAHRRRFPGLARALDRFGAARLACASKPLSEIDLVYVRGVYAAWARWHDHADLARAFALGGSGVRALACRAAELRALGVDPLHGMFSWEKRIEMETLGNRIMKHRLAAGWSQAELARRARLDSPARAAVYARRAEEAR